MSRKTDTFLTFNASFDSSALAFVHKAGPVHATEFSDSDLSYGSALSYLCGNIVWLLAEGPPM